MKKTQGHTQTNRLRERILYAILQLKVGIMELLKQKYIIIFEILPIYKDFLHQYPHVFCRIPSWALSQHYLCYYLPMFENFPKVQVENLGLIIFSNHIYQSFQLQLILNLKVSSKFWKFYAWYWRGYLIKVATLNPLSY